MSRSTVVTLFLCVAAGSRSSINTDDMSNFFFFGVHYLGTEIPFPPLPNSVITSRAELFYPFVVSIC